MGALQRGTASQHTAPRMHLLAALVVGAVWIPGCGTPAPRSAASLEAALAAADEGSPPGREVLRVRLAFGAGADLDLFVSDPWAEAVYFANSPSASGGALEEDRRCEHPAPRFEIVRFEQPPPGRYRVGVDYAEACGKARPAPFVVELSYGTHRELRRGTLEPGRFEVIVMEFDLEASGDP